MCSARIRFVRELRVVERVVSIGFVAAERVEIVLGVEVVGRPVEGIALYLAQKLGPVGAGHFNHHLGLRAAFLNEHQLVRFMHKRVTSSLLSIAELAKRECQKHQHMLPHDGD